MRNIDLYFDRIFFYVKDEKTWTMSYNDDILDSGWWCMLGHAWCCGYFEIRYLVPKRGGLDGIPDDDWLILGACPFFAIAYRSCPCTYRLSSDLCRQGVMCAIWYRDCLDRNQWPHKKTPPMRVHGEEWCNFLLKWAQFGIMALFLRFLLLVLVG